MSFLIKVFILYVIMAFVFSWLVDYIDEHSDYMWNYILEKYDDVMERIEQFIYERSEKEREDNDI